MTDSRETDAINEALIVIDRGLGTVQSRELVSTSEVADLLLDLRLLLMAAAVDAEPSGVARVLTRPSGELEELVEALLDAGLQAASGSSIAAGSTCRPMSRLPL